MTHPLSMSLSKTGWRIDPTLLEDISFELVHSDTTGDCFMIRLTFANGSDAMIDIEMAPGTAEGTYDLLTEAIRVRRVPSLAESDESDP